MPEPNFDSWQDFSDRRVFASVLWRRGVIVGIVVVRRRDGWCAVVAIPDEAHRRLARGVSRQNVIRFQAALCFAVEWELRELLFEETRELCVPSGGEPAHCGSLRVFGGEFIGVDIGEFDMPDDARLH